MSKLRPLSDHIVVKMLKDEPKTASGIVLPETAKDKSNQGEVVSVGPGKLVDDKRIAPEVKAGDRILYSEYAGQKVELDREEYQIIREDDVLAVLE